MRIGIGRYGIDAGIRWESFLSSQSQFYLSRKNKRKADKQKFRLLDYSFELTLSFDTFKLFNSTGEGVGSTNVLYS